MNAEQERDAAVERIEVVLTTTALAGLFWPKVRKAITAELEAAEQRGYERAKGDLSELRVAVKRAVLELIMVDSGGLCTCRSNYSGTAPHPDTACVYWRWAEQDFKIGGEGDDVVVGGVAR